MIAAALFVLAGVFLLRRVIAVIGIRRCGMAVGTPSVFAMRTIGASLPEIRLRATAAVGVCRRVSPISFGISGRR
ncbi:MAG TPA: hypothetical protein VLF15_11505 [Pseudoxanthomonas sp.]|nr:hypothetical protein [Pseudoxanthomonas sp.]